MATCGESHTLLLDSDGNIWFSGSLLSVGLETTEIDRKKEFTLLSSMNNKYPKEKMIYIATGQNHNLALSGSGKAFGFGRNDYCKSGGKIEDNIAFFELIKSNDAIMSLVACGRKHSFICNMEGFPYSWGNITLGRLGINPTSFDQKEKETYCIECPKEIFALKRLFQGNNIFIRNI